MKFHEDATKAPHVDCARVVEAKHDLAHDVGGLALGEVVQPCESVEELTALHHLRYDVEVVFVFDQVHNSDNIRMRLLTQDAELILQQLDVDVLLLYRSLLHYLDRERLLGILEHAQFDCPECTLSKRLAKQISVLNILELLEFLEVGHLQRLGLRLVLEAIHLTLFRVLALAARCV